MIIRFPKGYPFQPPRLIFLTPIFRPSVSTDGVRNLREIDSENWSPQLVLTMVLLGLQMMLADPSLAERNLINEEVDTMFAEGEFAFNVRAKEWTREHVMHYMAMVRV